MIDSRTGGSTTTSGHSCRSQQGLELRYILHVCERLELPSPPLADSMMSWKVSIGQRGGIVYERLRNESGPHVAGGTWGEGGQPAAAPRHFFMVSQFYMYKESRCKRRDMTRPQVSTFQELHAGPPHRLFDPP